MKRPTPIRNEKLVMPMTIVMIIVVASVVGVVALSSPSSLTRTITGTATTNNSTGLKFSMSLNSTTVQQGHIIAVSLNLYNTFDRNNNVTGAANWQLTNESENSGGSVGWNCAQNDVFRIEVVMGRYDVNNFSKGAPLDVFVWHPLNGTKGGPNQCLYYVRSANWTAPALYVPWWGANYYIFRPTSDVAWWVTFSQLHAQCLPRNASYLPCGRPGGEAVMSEMMILKPSIFASSAGEYTVICGDEWGDLVAAHFNVTSP